MKITQSHRSNKAYTDERSCVVCGKSFFMNAARSKMTCSQECRYERQKDRQKQVRRMEREMTRLEVLKRPATCLFCGTRFMRKKASQKRCPSCIEKKIKRIAQVEKKKNPTQQQARVFEGETHQYFMNSLREADLRSQERFSARVQHVGTITGETQFKEEIANFLSKGGKVRVIPPQTEESSSAISSTSFSFSRYGETGSSTFGLPQFLGGAVCGAFEGFENSGDDPILGV